MRWFESVWLDLKFGARSLRKSPIFTTVALLSLALGIGANAAIYQLLDVVWLRSLPVHHPNEIVEVRTSRILAKTNGGNLTLFAFDAGQGLTEHTSPFDALVLVLEGALDLTIGGAPVRATPGTIVRMPANIPHGLDATEATRMLLVMLKD